MEVGLTFPRWHLIDIEPRFQSRGLVHSPLGVTRCNGGRDGEKNIENPEHTPLHRVKKRETFSKTFEHAENSALTQRVRVATESRIARRSG